MKALLIFGQKFGGDNKPLVDLGKKIAELGHRVSFAQWDDKTFSYDLLQSEIIIGHSYGGDRALTIAKVNGIRVKFLGLIDPVAHWFPLHLKNYWKRFEVPSNVQKVDCFTRALNVIPPAGTLKSTTLNHRKYEGIQSSHANLPAHPKVVSTILESIKSLG